MSNIAATTKRKWKNQGIPETHCDTKIEYRKCNFTWTIIQYSTLVDRRDILKSSKFSAIGDDFLWYVKLSYKHGNSSNRDSVSDQDFVNITLYCDYECLQKYSPVSGDVEISVLKFDGSEIGNKTSSFKLRPCDYDWYDYDQCNIHPFTRICEIKQWLFQDNLTILCQLNYYKNTDVVSVSTPLDSNPAITFEHSLPCDLEEILNEGCFSDVAISVKGKNYPAHKAILSSRCSVFKSMFRSNMQETKENQIVITDIEQETFEEMLYYIYTGKTKNLEECAYELLPAADKYDLSDLRIMCEEVLLTKLSTDNVAKILILADTYHFEKLKAYTLRFIKMKYAGCKEFKSTEVWNILTTSRPQLMKDILDVFFDEKKLRDFKR